MKSLIVGLISLACATSVEAAEVWTCSYATQGEPGFYRFELSPPDLIETVPPFFISFNREHYRILLDNDYGLVATLSISEIEVADQKATVGAWTLVIDKETGEFLLSGAIAGTISGEVPPEWNHQPVHGKCLKN
jgi:hypothetical protein